MRDYEGNGGRQQNVQSPIPSDIIDPIMRHLVVIGLARNCAKVLRTEVQTVSAALANCTSLSWLIIESDSEDETIHVLEQLKSEVPHFRFITLGNLRNSLPKRTERLACCRNAYLRELESNPYYAKVEYVVIADLDGVNSMLTSSAIETCWKRTDWDVVTANQRGRYYDIWALRHDQWCPDDCWQQFHFLRSRNVGYKKALTVAVFGKMIRIVEDGPWIRVRSAFGGLAIYRRSALEGCSYSGLNSEGTEICEHTTLHRQITDAGGRIFINPQLINASRVRHALNVVGPASTWKTIGRRVVSWFDCVRT